MLNQIDLSRSDLNLLVLFEVVMRHRNVGRAAAELNLSPSAVSHGLGRLRVLLNDPLFLKTPRGVVPTDRALALAPRIAEALENLGDIIAVAEPFDAATSTRRFRFGAGDAFLCEYGPALSAQLARQAPRIGISVLHIVPSFRQSVDEGAWDHVLNMLESRELDVALVPWLTCPARFATRPVGEGRLVVATRADHPYAHNPTLDTYCQSRHLVVSIRGDPVTATDAALARLGRRRDVIMTAPSFSSALFLAAESDLVVSLPDSLVTKLGARFGLVGTPFPFDAPPSTVAAVTTRAALKDNGVAWLTDLVCSVVLDTPKA
ncbi:LysR family transcriptional regulator [Tabrizicola sp.]|uniref:LysR family transcriptional regulator n=1 Tax=Tabrizicola sp. TaxID=2005166 RepID=UPI00286C1E50|nr:LysR family transcriptional regulator [Tabrizicola sp.]